MTETIEQQLTDNTVALDDTGAEVLSFERRRAGRLEVSPILVPLLRDPASAAPDLDSAGTTGTPYRDYLETDPFHSPLAPARGIAIGLAISMLFWGAIGYMIFR